MRNYETIFILDPLLEEEKINQEVEKVKGVITAKKGEVLHEDRWGMRKLAYSIKRKEQGYYTLLVFRGGPEIPAELEASFKLNENCLRYFTTVATKATLKRIKEEEAKSKEEK